VAKRPRSRTDDDLIHIRNEVLLALEVQDQAPQPVGRPDRPLIAKPAA